MFRTVFSYLLFCTVVLAGCALNPTLYKDAGKVQFQRQNSNIITGCKKLGPIASRGRGTFLGESALDDAKRGLRNEAVRLNGDTVVITNFEGDIVIDVYVQAIAFRCY